MDMKKFAADMARQAGQMTLDFMKNRNQLNISCKMSSADIVTQCDKNVEQFIRENIMRNFPEHRIFGEEFGQAGSADSPYLWIVDPIDGTASF